MKKNKKASLLAGTLVIWAMCIGSVLWYASKPVQVKYIEILSPPQIVYREQEIYIEPEAQNGFPTAYYQEIADSITEQEIELLAQLVYLEARGESLLGQRAVAAVVFNRVLDSRFPNTVTEVVYQDEPCIQFAPIGNLAKVVPTEKQYEAVYSTLSESVPLLPKDVLYFSTRLNGYKEYEKIGNYYFCY